MRRRKALVAMSGGVDSSVAAALAVEAGYEVTGVMLKLWQGEAANNESGCCNLSAADDARRVADVLGIPFYVLNFAGRFSDSVIDDFHRSYAAGHTPNPCVRCNQWIKFGSLLERASALGADVLVTGHYARVRRAGGRYRLLRGADPAKDQSYVLWMLSQAELARSWFPVGEMSKPETRAIAAELGLRTAAKPDSQEICFVRRGDVDSYVGEHMPEAAVAGPILDGDGNRVGTHRGIGRYTVGQRRGLGVALGEPVFVTSIDASGNSVRVGPRRALAVTGFEAAEASFVADPPEGLPVAVQHRAHGDVHRGVAAARPGGGLIVRYDQPVEAVAPGQSAALYKLPGGDELIGGGIIERTFAAEAAAS